MRTKLALVLVIVLIGIGILHVRSNPAMMINTAMRAPGAPTLVKVRQPLEPTYGHPMVPGGVHSLAELRANAWMYPGLDLARVHEDIVMHSYLAYVSYRYRGITRWTRRMRVIRAGERIWTDGELVILERCGNLVSGRVPDRVDTLPYEPRDIYPTYEVVPGPTGVQVTQSSPTGLDVTVDTPTDSIGSPRTNAPEDHEANIVPFAPVPIIAPGSSHAPDLTHNHPTAIYTPGRTRVVDVPEPPTYLTLSFGLLFAYVLCKRYLP